MNSKTVMVMIDGAWFEAQWDRNRVGCFLQGVWYNMASFQAYSFEQ